ncbi:hypothetical protein F5888DRAFT_1805482 [Russula emetica]|nr:hypothetical protein F5888DRAFT_1805482 [Russula emetica]
MSLLVDEEVEHCAAVIAATFLNPISVNWDYDRWAKSMPKLRESGTFLSNVQLGFIMKPTTLVDRQGNIFMWYLFGLLLPHRVKELNRVTECLKKPLCHSAKSRKSGKGGKGSSSWQINNLTCDGEEAIFGAGKLSLSVGKFQLGHSRLQDDICSSPDLHSKPIQAWLQLIKPVEQLLDEVLQIVHLKMWLANHTATSLLLKILKTPLPIWPTVYPSMEVIANQLMP